MKKQKDRKFDRYTKSSMRDLPLSLTKIEIDVLPAKIYDLSKDYFDPREPDSPDIFIVLKDNSQTIWLKDAMRTVFDWSRLQIITLLEFGIGFGNKATKKGDIFKFKNFDLVFDGYRELSSEQKSRSEKSIA